MQTILRSSGRAHHRRQQGALTGAGDTNLAEGAIPESDPPESGVSAGRMPPGRVRGQSLFEYSVIILFVVLVVILSLVLIAPVLNSIFNRVPGLF